MAKLPSNILGMTSWCWNGQIYHVFGNLNCSWIWGSKKFEKSKRNLVNFVFLFSRGDSAKERIMCPVCKTIVVRRVYRRHFETMHCVQEPVTCQFCQKVFKHRYSLDCHQRQTHPHQRVTSRALGCAIREQLIKNSLATAFTASNSKAAEDSNWKRWY